MDVVGGLFCCLLEPPSIVGWVGAGTKPPQTSRLSKFGTRAGAGEGVIFLCVGLVLVLFRRTNVQFSVI